MLSDHYVTSDNFQNKNVPDNNTVNEDEFASKVEKRKYKWKQTFNFKKYKWYEWFAVVPALFLSINGGALGALFGLWSMFYIIRICRSERYSVRAKIVLVIILNLVVFAIYMTVVSLVLSIIKEIYPLDDLM